MAKNLNGRVLYQEVAFQIEQTIMRGEWMPGQKLPPLLALAAHFQVSRAVVREACSLLVGSGLLELRHGDGTYVRVFSLDHFLRPVHAALLLGQADVRVLLEVALWLEQGIIEAAAARRTDEDCAALADALLAMEAGLGNADALLEAECCFHFALATAADNEMGSNLLRIVYQPLAGVLRHLLEAEDCGQEWIAVHRALFDSVLQMDRTAAGRQLTLYRKAQEERVRMLRETPMQALV